MIARTGRSGGADSPAPQARRTGYALDNAAGQARARFDALATIFDPGTIGHLLGLGVDSGWHCLEVGAGGGSIAAWLCGRVGPGGRVVATDIDPRFLEELAEPNLEVRRHDIDSDSLPEAAFDLVHARLLLAHLPGRDAVLARLVAALKPGAWILLEEFDSLSMRADPLVNPAETALGAWLGAQRVLASRGVEMRFGRLLAGCLRHHGREDTGAEGRVFMWQGRSAGARLLRSNLEQLRREMVDCGWTTNTEVEHDLTRLDSEDFLAPSPVMWASWGRRPARPAPT
jgi:SAM-dependent methyltransferase